MVKGQFWRLCYREPLGIGGVRRGFGVVLGKFDEGVIRDADHAFAGIALDFPKRIKLLQKHIFEPGFFLEFAASGFVQRFVHADEPARQRPTPFERFEPALDEQHFQFAIIEPEDDAVNGQGRARILICIWHRKVSESVSS